MNKSLLVLVILFVIWWVLLTGRSSGYTYQNVGNEPGMPFWAPGALLGPTEDLAKV